MCHPEKLKVIGLPVAERFCKPCDDKQKLRQKLGWPQDKLDGACWLEAARAWDRWKRYHMHINGSGLDIALTVITGRNQKLKDSLEKIQWNIPAFIYGFVHDMPDFMRAADILLTKAGPGTISEALIAGLPIILYHRISGQEEGNVSYVIDEGAGVWAPDSRDIVETIRRWIEEPQKTRTGSSECLPPGAPECLT